MSNALAIATVTYILRDLILQAVHDATVTAAVNALVKVTATPPDLIATGQSEVPQVNLFLYHVAPNQGWRNVGMPSRDDRGERLTNHPLALDLYYMISAYGKNNFEADILLGYAMQSLHDTPVLTRRLIEDKMTLQPGATEPLISLSTSELAQQIEMVKVVPQALNNEEMSKLWAAFGAKFRPSAAYHASLVLIEKKRPTRSPLPVLSRGKRDPVTGRDEGVIVQPNLLPPFPTLEELVPPDKQLAIRMGEFLVLRGHHLDGTQVSARFIRMRSGDALELPAQAGATSTAFEAQIPPDPPGGPVTPDSPENPDNWQAGIHLVNAKIQRPGEPTRITNSLAISIAPRILGPVQVVVNNVTEQVELTVVCSPKVWNTQQASLIVGNLEIPAEPILADKTDTLVFLSNTSSLPVGETFWVRLRVDGVESILIDRSGAAPVFDPSQQVTI